MAKARKILCSLQTAAMTALDEWKAVVYSF
jgi:hypothetical protein